jgi:uncharacterized protein (DUF2141 family)
MGMVCKSQTVDLTVVVKGVKEVKGSIMVAAGDMSKPQEMKYDMAGVASTDDAVLVLKEVPVGRCDLFVYQDLNGNYQLDRDEEDIPVEPCYMKEKVSVKDGVDNRMEVRLVNVREMMGAKK